MYPRTNYEMTEADLEKILDACKPVPMIMLHIGGSRSPQERANDAWAELGSRMGFDSTTVEPRVGMGNRFFTAVPTETPEARKEREDNEAIEAKKANVERLEKEVEEAKEKLRKALE